MFPALPLQIPLLSVPQPTNGLTYFRGMASLNSLPSELVPYVPLFCSTMASMGAGSMDYRQLAQKIESHTGGIEFSPVCSTHHSGTRLTARVCACAVAFSSVD